MPNRAGQPVNKAPYKVEVRDGKYVVLNNGGEVKGTHPDRDSALAQLRALYASVPNADKTAARKKFTGTQKRAVHERAREGDPSATAKDKNPAGGLSAAGRKKFGVKKGVTSYSGASEADKKRWVRWALRFTKTPRPLKDDKGNPTRYALMFHAWGEPVPTSADAVRAVHTKAVSRAKSLGMGQYEKADTFFFEHNWQPVPGHPEQVAVCDLCGLNRWSDEHVEQSKDFSTDKRDKMAGAGKAMKDGSFPIESEQDLRNAIMAAGRAKDPAAAKAHIKRRASALGKTNLLPQSWRESSAVDVERLRRLYGGPQSAAAGQLGAPMSPLKPVDMGDDNDTQAEENAEIEASSKVPAAQEPHPFMEAQYPDEAGHPRCRLCGLGTPAPVHADFQPAQRIAAGDRLSVPVGTVTLTGASTNSNPYRLNGAWTMTSTPGAPVRAGATSVASAPAQVTERLAPVVMEGQAPPHGDDRVKAFVTEANGKTLITAPASAFQLETAMAANEHMLWMRGRFVGAEKANRNGAFWTTGDLELGKGSVLHGPLNWLHEARHVIGTIADASLHTHELAADRPLAEPFIEATSVIWKWVYPDEAWVVEQASDAGKLWYSMECVSKEVACAGQTGCGATASYGDYLSGKGGTCDHMRERSGTRRFAEPTFLGGAVIVPPVRPGWAEADAQVMRRATAMAEKAFEQAGQPDVAASEWEQLMAQVLRFAQG